MTRAGRRHRVLGAVLLGTTGVVLAGCGGIPPEPSVVARAASSTPSAGPTALTAAAISTDFDAFVATQGGEIALAWAPVGRPDAVQTVGHTTDADAWSTLKVPIAVAALAEAGGAEKASGARREHVRAAIEWSDNTAAAKLYRSLGSETDAEEAVEARLRAAGDTRTQVNRDDAGRSRGFGRTVWRVDDAARYVAHLPCDSDSAVVHDEMGRIAEEHRWGLGAVTGTRFKGGWGPSDHGYLVRQIGILDHDGGRTGVSLIVRAKDGSHESAAATASKLATWLSTRLGPADAGTCPGGAAASASPDISPTGT